eukprot:11221858-Lingulodinium_polyedra.AAC.1
MRVERANCAAATKCVSDSIVEQLSSDICSEQRCNHIWLLRRDACRDSRIACVDLHMVVNAWNACMANRFEPQQPDAFINAFRNSLRA